MSVHVVLNLLNKLRIRNNMLGYPSISPLCYNELNKFNNTGSRMIDSIYDMEAHF